MNVYRETSLASIRPLLAEAGLPTADLSEELEHFFACGVPGNPAGVVGLELYGSHAILRSLAVSPGVRRRGCGKELVAAAERYARAHEVGTMFLLTETARGFFEALGYRLTDRNKAPEAIRESREFAELCPASAAFMSKTLTKPRTQHG